MELDRARASTGTYSVQLPSPLVSQYNSVEYSRALFTTIASQTNDGRVLRAADGSQVLSADLGISSCAFHTH